MQTQNVSSKVKTMFDRLPMADACELHQRLAAGKTDIETRLRLRAALRKSGMHQPKEWQ